MVRYSLLPSGTELRFPGILQLSIYNTELSIHEVALSSKAPDFDLGLDFFRIECLYACLQATKSWFEVYLTIPPGQYPRHPVTILTQLGHNMVALHRLATFVYIGWDLAMVRQTVDLSMICTQVVQKMSEVRAAAGLISTGDDTDPYTEISVRIHSVVRTSFLLFALPNDYYLCERHGAF